MENHHLVGLIMVVAGVSEALIGFWLLAPRLPDPEKKKIILVAMSASAVFLIALGGVFFAGLILV